MFSIVLVIFYNLYTLPFQWNSGPCWALFGPKTSTQSFPQNINFSSFKPLCCCNVMQKNPEKLYELTFDNIWKTSFWAPFTPFWSQNLNLRFSIKNVVWISFKLIYFWNIKQKIKQKFRKIMCLNYSYNLKNLFWSENFKTRFFP